MLKTIINEFSKVSKENTYFIIKIFLSKITGIKINQINIDSVFLKEKEIDILKEYIQEFLKGKPISKIINESCFYGYDFYVNDDVLDPRPETEILVNTVITDYEKNFNEINILDICTGSGVILLTLLNEKPKANGVGIDISNEAIKVSFANQKKMKLEKRCDFLQSDFCKEILINKYFEKFDIITSNPPYIKTKDIEKLDKSVTNYDPIIALDGGHDGIQCYIKILDQINFLLKPNGRVYFEIGFDIFNDVQNLIIKSSFVIEKIVKDLANIPRVLVIKKKTF